MRTTSTQINEEFAKNNSGVAILYFLTFSHPILADALLFVNDLFDYQRGGKLWRGVPFEITFLTDSDQPPQCKLNFQNIDRTIGEKIRLIDSAVRLKIEILTTLDFDLNTTPRAEVGTAAVEYVADYLYLVDVNVTPLSIEATLKSWFEYAREPWPSIKVTQDRFPAIFR